MSTLFRVPSGSVSPTANCGHRMGESSRMVLARGQGSSPPRGGSGSEPLLARLLRAVEPWRALGPPSNYGCPMLPSTMHLEDKAYFNLGRVWTTNVVAIFARGWSAHDGLKTILDCFANTVGLFQTVWWQKLMVLTTPIEVREIACSRSIIIESRLTVPAYY